MRSDRVFAMYYVVTLIITSFKNTPNVIVKTLVKDINDKLGAKYSPMMRIHWNEG